MTAEEFVSLYSKVIDNAVIHGTGFIKIAMVNGELEASVVDPKDYRFLEPEEEKKDELHGKHSPGTCG